MQKLATTTERKAQVQVDSRCLKRAEEIVTNYRVVIERDERGYVGKAIELPTAYGWGRTADECLSDTLKNAAVLAALLLQERCVPPRAGEMPLDNKVHFRLTTDEKLILEAEATRLGFKGVSEYARSVLLAKHRK
jgi:predicted RNase H-like HicB family nuclease